MGGKYRRSNINIYPTSTSIASIVAQHLSHDDWTVRRKAMHTLCSLGMDAVALHGDALVRFLVAERLCFEALNILCDLEAVVLSGYATAIVKIFAHRCWIRCHSALVLIGKMTSVALIEHAGAVAWMLRDDNLDVRSKAMHILCELEPSELALYANAVVRALGDKEYHVRCAAEKALSKLDQSMVRHTRAPYSRLLVVNRSETVWDFITRRWVPRAVALIKTVH